MHANQTPHSSARIAAGIAAIQTFALARLRLLSLTHLGCTGSSIFVVATFFSICSNHAGGNPKSSTERRQEFERNYVRKQ
ncbi:hypothetical protein KDW55_20925 [Burkholderia sp. AU19243]|uniref:hypothetical protein n=1 Tax=Burkholderia TaxID=32008 RepID=UPI001B92960F|nr:hypothetical protein [Burkholderia sp. AU19243]MBR8365787.1 hypothetical protein [Burkholderia sp. AU19243]